MTLRTWPKKLRGTRTLDFTVDQKEVGKTVHNHREGTILYTAIYLFMKKTNDKCKVLLRHRHQKVSCKDCNFKIIYIFLFTVLIRPTLSTKYKVNADKVQVRTSPNKTYYRRWFGLLFFLRQQQLCHVFAG